MFANRKQDSFRFGPDPPALFALQPTLTPELVVTPLLVIRCVRALGQDAVCQGRRYEEEQESLTHKADP